MTAVAFILLHALHAAAPAAGGSPLKQERLAILPVVIQREDGKVTLASVFDRAAQAAARRRGVTVLAYEEIFSADNSAVLEGVRDCGADAPCLAARLSQLNASIGLIVLANLTTDPPLLALRLLERNSGTFRTTST